MAVTGIVEGNVRFPDHPTHEGHWGLVGGEDVQAIRDSFRSVGEAMTWCRKVLDGQLKPRNPVPAGPLLEPRTEVQWDSARVRWSNGADEVNFVTAADRTWVKEKWDGHHGEVVRTDKL